MPGIIQLLPSHVANQIAAGEVVQRPASVVKELLENAVDAKATSVKLLVKDGGKTLIQVIDNGQGMHVTDAILCFERHATSKIRQAEDLFALHTKGFRGEALASIAAIAHIELKTRQASDELGTHLVMEGSKLVSQEEAVVPGGTSVAVKHLFYNIPARRNFLKSEQIELRHILDEFQRIALAHADIHFSMAHNGNELYNLPASPLRQRIVNLFVGKTNEKLVPVKEDTALVSLTGFVTKPDFAKKNRGEQFFFVNDRFIKSGYLHHAVMSAYEGLLKDGYQPGYYLYLSVPPQSIDINIHPTKTEVKFDDEQALYAILRAAVKHGLGQFNITPVLDFDRDANLDVPYHYKDLAVAIPTIEVTPGFNPFGVDTPVKQYSSTAGNKSQNTWESLYVGLKNERLPDKDAIFFENEVPALFEEEQVKEEKRSYQVQKKYIVSAIKSGLVIIDQQRAHQRILYERYLAHLTMQEAVSQPFIFPVELVLSKPDFTLLQDLKSLLLQAGFIIEFLEQDKVVISAAPTAMNQAQIQQVVDELITDLQEGIPESSFSQSDSVAKSLARSMAIKYGTLLSDKEQESLVNSLFACKEAQVSPFGKPTFITLSVDEIDKKFTI